MTKYNINNYFPHTAIVSNFLVRVCVFVCECVLCSRLSMSVCDCVHVYMSVSMGI